MAFNSIAEPTIEEGMKSKFNEAFLKMHRLHRLQDTMNICEMNILMYNIEYMAYNYEVKIRCCQCLSNELWGRLDETEKREILELETAIDNFIMEHPVHADRVHKIENRSIVKMDVKTWMILKNAIKEYERKIRELLTVKELDTANKEQYDVYEGF